MQMFKKRRINMHVYFCRKSKGAVDDSWEDVFVFYDQVGPGFCCENEISHVERNRLQSLFVGHTKDHECLPEPVLHSLRNRNEV